MPSTFVHGLLPPACVYLSKQALPRFTLMEWAKLLFIALILANSPDLDIIPASLSSHWKQIHRNWGHNIFAVIVWISLGRWALKKFLPGKLTSKTAWTLSTLLVLSHLVLDAMHDVNPEGIRRGVPLFWPITSTEFYLPFKWFKILKLDPGLHFLVAHVTSREFWHGAIFVELGHAALLAVIWGLGFRLAFWIFRRTSGFMKKASSGISHLSPRSSRKYTPANPSLPLQGDNPTRTGTNCR
jgi:membrane-bound metal-dependent hydrolase YbcI (DUF457 family)